MEVEARPPALRDGKLGYSTQDEDNLRLTVSDGEELPSDEEQELLKSPVKERLQPVNGTTAGSTEETLDDSCETLNFENKCNGLERVDAYRTKRVKSVGDDISVREENDERTNHAIEGVGQVAAGDLKAINGLSRPKIVVDATGDVELGAEHVEAEDEDSSLPTVVNVACLGENDIGDCPMVLAATSLPLQGIELAGSEAILDAADGPSETRNTAALSAMEADEEELETLEEESHSETANELLDEEPTNVDSINSSQALGEETGDFRSEESTAHIAITDSGEVSIDGTMDNADEDIDAADTEMENDQGEGSDSPGYQGMAEDILPIIESELDPELDGQPEGGASYDTEFERPDDESGCLDAEDENPNDEVIADDISIHESEDSRMATDVSVGPQITGGAPFNESEDSRTDCEPAHASNDSRLSSPSIETKTSQSEAESAAREMVGGKPEGMDTSKQLHSAVGELEESEKSGDTVDATASSGLLELLLCKKTVRRRASSGNQHDAPPPMKIRRLSSLEGPEEGSKTLSEFKKLSTKEKPDSSKLELKPELTATHQNSVDIDLKHSKPVKVDIDVDEKKNAVLLIVDAEETKTEIKTPSIETPVRRTGNDCALDALFNGKDEITLSRKTFIKMMKSYVSQYMTTYNSFGKQGMRTAVKAEDSYNKVGSQISCYEKQKEDMKMVMKKLLDDRESSKQWDPSVVPAKTTRSVGLQVSTVGSIYVSKNAEVHDPASKRVSTLPNPNNAMMQQKIAYAQQQQATAATKAQNTNRPTAKKSTTATTNTQLARSGPSRIATSPINRIVGNLKTAMPGQHLQQLNGVKTMLPKTTDPLALMRSSNTTLSPNGKTFLISAKKNVVPTAKAPAPVRATINPALMRALGSAMSSPASTTGKSQIIHTPNRNVAPGPGRPIVRTPSTVPVPTAVTPQTAKKASSIKAPVQATIDLTDDDGPQASKTNPGTNALGLRKLIPVPPKILPAPAPKQYKHPALPSNPPNFNALTAPPKPYLGICDTQEGTQGIMLTWHFNQAKPHMKVAKFQVFAYQESKSGAEDAWKKVGDVDALPLPMACTLTQFREGYTYHFIVRAVDELGNIGPFSAPNTITLVKRT